MGKYASLNILEMGRRRQIWSALALFFPIDSGVASPFHIQFHLT